MSANERHAVELADARLRPVEHLRAGEMIGDLDQRLRRDDFDLRARPGASAPQAKGRSAMPAPLAPIAAGSTRRRGDRTVEPELAQHAEAGERVRGMRRSPSSGRARSAVVMAAFLGQVGGARLTVMRRAGSATRRRSEPRARAPFLRHRLVGQADDIEGRRPGATCTCTSHVRGLDALEGDSRDTLDHGDLS